MAQGADPPVGEAVAEQVQAGIRRTAGPLTRAGTAAEATAPERTGPAPGATGVGLFPGWATSPPVIDGSIGGPEWSDAASYNITLGGSPVILYLMNDADYLYMAIDNQKDTTLDPADYELICVEDEGGTPPVLSDGTWNASVCPSTEGFLAVGNLVAGGLPSDEVFEGVSASSGNCDPVAAVGLNGAYSNASGHMVYEMQVDLAASELHAQPGETFGAYVEAFDGAAGTSGATPPSPDFANPATFLPLTLAIAPTLAITAGWAATPPTLDGTLGGGEWSAATVLDITKGLNPVLLYVMNDADFLYLAVDSQADATSDPYDYAGIAFDDEGGTPPLLGDGTWNAATCPSTEGFAAVGDLAAVLGLPVDRVYAGQSASGGCTTEVGNGVWGAYSHASGHMVYELRLDLNLSQLHAQPGQTFGAYVENFDGASFTVAGATPTPDFTDPSTYASLTLATPPTGIASGWASTPPSLDGSLDPGEWGDALTYDISLSATPVVLYLMNDADYLYMAVDDQANTSLDVGDYAALLFEDEGGAPPFLGDGAWNAAACPSTEGGVLVGNFALGGFPSDDLYIGISATEECVPDAATGLSGAYDDATGHMVFEMRVDLASSQLHAMPGETFGAGFLAYDNLAEVSTGALPAAIDPLDASTLTTLTLAIPLTGVPRSGAPLRTLLEPARPNPFGGSTELHYALRETGPVKIEVFTVLGQRVASLVDGTMPAGEHLVHWSGRDSGGSPVADGIYYVRMRADDVDQTKAVVRLH